ncbi:unnamed protein product [Owenia fusiformis]|uniref:Uncharacterized protein n=1 Tax=Owenia fusiformis TaxID=6347 RepID=A0A8J1TYC1_OWEFU|nr:unnamed protein product [Owenia fusiformis]
MAITNVTFSTIDTNGSYGPKIQPMDDDNGSSRNEFDPVDYPDTARLVTIIGGAIILLGGLFLNSMTIKTIYKTPKLHNVTYLFLVLLNGNDIVFSVWSITFIVITDIYNKWIFGSGFCQAFAFVNGTLLGLELFMLMFITMSRYIKVVHPQYFNIIFTKKSIMGMILFAIIFVTACLLPPLTGMWGEIEYIARKNICSFKDKNDNYHMFLEGITVLLPLTVIIISYVRIYIVVHNQSKTLKRHSLMPNGDTKRPPSNTMLKRKERQLTKTLVALVVTFILSYTPYLVVAGVDKEIQYPILHRIATILLWSNSCWNNVVLVGMNSQFRDYWLAQLKCKDVPADHSPVVKRVSDSTNIPPE